MRPTPEDENIESRSKPVTETAPALTPLSDLDQDRMGNAMGLPVHKWRKISKTVVLTLPQTPLATRWMKWASATKNLPKDAGFMMMHPNNYNEQALTSNRPHTAQHQDISLRAFGKPLVFWQFTFSVDDDDESEPRFEL